MMFGNRLDINQQSALAVRRTNSFLMMHQAQYHQLVKRGDYPTVLSIGVAVPAALCAGLHNSRIS